jgi:hypothetical protein
MLMITSRKGVGYGWIWMDMDGCGWIWVDMVGMKWIQEKVNFDFDFQKFRMETQNGSQ